MITSQNIDYFESCLIVIDELGNMLKGDIADYLASRRLGDIQMIVMGHKPTQIVNTARRSSDTFYITTYITYNVADLFENSNDKHKCEHDFHGIIKELNRSYYNYTIGMHEALRYGLIKFNVKDGTSIIFDRNRTTIYDSRIGFRNLEALSLKDEQDNGEINKLKDYMKPLMKIDTNRNTINKANYIFYFNKILISKGIRIQNNVTTK